METIEVAGAGLDVGEGANDGVLNMALDAALLEAAEVGGAGFRVYGWDGAWVSLGMNQAPERDLLPNAPVRFVMRPTGGKAVLHGHDVTVAAAVPLESIAASTGADVERLARSVRTVYRALAVPIVGALRQCGLPARLAEETPFFRRRGVGGPRSADCFRYVSANDIVDDRTGVKVCGCALRVTQGAVLLQASIPAGPPLVDPREVFAAPWREVPANWDANGFAGRFAEEFSKSLGPVARSAADP